MRGGHIPGAKSIPWARAVNPDDGTFKTAEELRALYLEQNGARAGDDTIAYCRIGERSSHTWFALKYLLGFENVRNYDGSWTEWGNLVGRADREVRGRGRCSVRNTRTNNDERSSDTSEAVISMNPPRCRSSSTRSRCSRTPGTARICC